jgi:prepilin-type N-terminal cleavage/methylation domain-containing protein
MDSGASRSSERGFSLVEVAMATALMSILAIGVAQLFAVGTAANLRAKNQTSLTLLAVQKMEQLKALQWGFDQREDSLGLPISDLVTDLSECRRSSSPAHCATQSAGQSGAAPGLNPSPNGTLDGNVPGYVDYLDRNGGWVGNGAAPPPTAHYVRRWSIDPLPTNPNNTLVFQVVVMTQEAALAANAAGRGDVRLVSVKTRKAP